MPETLNIAASLTAVPAKIESAGNRIIISGRLDTTNMRKLHAAMHTTAKVKGYEDIELDFSNCSGAAAGAMLTIAAITQCYLVQNIDVSIVLPTDQKLRSLFMNTNWAHLIALPQFGESQYQGHLHLPALSFKTGEEQHKCVSLVVNAMLSALSDFDRSHFRSIEWSINEISDNVINHANSPIGGFLQIVNHQKTKTVEMSVCDAGVGIPKTLREGHPKITSDQEALDRAIREGVTRDKSVGQGNGLYGSWRIAQLSKGEFQIHSGRASLVSREKSGLHVSHEAIPFAGTLVVIKINYGTPLKLEEALNFRGRSHVPVDFVEVNYEEDEAGNIAFVMKKEAASFGSRTAGAPIRNKLINLIRISDGAKITLDFTDIPLVSSSFADEVFGKLFVDMGPISFMSQFDFRNIDPLVKGLIDKAITQRSRTG